MNIALKEEHSPRLCRTIRILAKSPSLGPGKVLLAETIWLFHDTGRFPQYARCKTFRDSISVNHGKLGADILVDNRFLFGLGSGESRTLINAVKFHDAFVIPGLEDAEGLFFLRLIRDADKLDIWRILLDFFEGGDYKNASSAGLVLPDTPDYPERVLS